MSLRVPGMDDRTLIGRLGFADPDKHDSTHDLACQYLTLPDNVRRLVDIVKREHYEQVRGFDGKVSFDTPRPEHPISKGEGQYRTTIGFIDLFLDVSPMVNRRFMSEHVAVEVKTGRAGMGQVIRQINLYREYIASQHTHWFLVTTYPETEGNVELLAESDIWHIELADAFFEWVKGKQHEPISRGHIL
jgi:hypothetical protein